jgi:hypothetical protein
MKKEFICSFTGVFISWILLSIANGQITNSIAQVKTESQPEKIIPEPKQLNSDLDSDFTFRNEINTKAVRNFITKYKNVPDAKWFKSANGLLVAYFISDSIQNWVFYNDRGDCEFSLRHYTEEKMPYDVRHLVKSKLYDYSIYHIAETTRNEKIAYTIKLEDKKSWKTIRVADGEMTTLEEYFKK